MNNQELIESLIEVKLSIMESADDTLWMRNELNCTVCEEIDIILIKLGANVEELEQHYNQAGSK